MHTAVFCCCLVQVSITNSLKDHSTGTGWILRLDRCHWNNPEDGVSEWTNPPRTNNYNRTKNYNNIKTKPQKPLYIAWEKLYLSKFKIPLLVTMGDFIAWFTDTTLWSRALRNHVTYVAASRHLMASRPGLKIKKYIHNCRKPMAGP